MVCWCAQNKIWKKIYVDFLYLGSHVPWNSVWYTQFIKAYYASTLKWISVLLVVKHINLYSFTFNRERSYYTSYNWNFNNKATSKIEILNVPWVLEILILDAILKVIDERIYVLYMILLQFNDNGIFMGVLLVIFTMEHIQIQPLKGKQFYFILIPLLVFN